MHDVDSVSVLRSAGALSVGRVIVTSINLVEACRSRTLAAPMERVNMRSSPPDRHLAMPLLAPIAVPWFYSATRDTVSCTTIASKGTVGVVSALSKLINRVTSINLTTKNKGWALRSPGSLVVGEFSPGGDPALAPRRQVKILCLASDSSRLKSV